MVFEVERRALIDSDGFVELKAFLDSNAEFVSEKEMKTFLFTQPGYLRFRLFKGKDKFMLTHKSDNLGDSCREEIELFVDNSNFDKMVRLFRALGFVEGTEFNTKRLTYRYDGFVVEVSDIDLMGIIVDVEALLENVSEAEGLEKDILNVFEKLGLKVLSVDDYKDLINKACFDNLKSVDDFNSYFS